MPVGHLSERAPVSSGSLGQTGQLTEVMSATRATSPLEHRGRERLGAAPGAPGAVGGAAPRDWGWAQAPGGPDSRWLLDTQIWAVGSSDVLDDGNFP